MEATAQYHSRMLIFILAAAQLPVLIMLALSPDSFLGCCLILAGWLLIIALQRHLEKVMLLVLLLIAWFPEFSQTEDAWSAEEFKSLYNYKPLGFLTASIFDYLFLAVLIVWIVKVAAPRGRELLRLPLVKEMVGFLCVSIFSLGFGLAKGYPAYYALREFRVSACFVCVFLMWISTVDSEPKIRQFAWTAAGIAFVVGGYGIVRFSLGMGKEYYDTLLVYYDIADSMVLFLGLFVLISLSYARKISWIVAGALAVPMVFSLLLSYRRGAWIACVVGLIALVRVQSRRARKRALGRWLIPAMGVVTIIVALNASKASSLVVERVQSIMDTSDDPSNVFRIMDALNALTTFAKHPVAGVGFGGKYDVEYTSSQVTDEFWDSVDRASHNGYLYILYKMGLIGFIAYVAVLWRFWRVWRAARQGVLHETYASAMVYACGIGAFAILINNMTSPVTDSLRPAILLAITMGCVVSGVITRDRVRRQSLRMTDAGPCVH